MFSWIGLAVVMLTASALLCQDALWGHWRSYVWNVRYAFNWDPGAAYLGTGLTLFDNRYATDGTFWPGHPGLPLMLLVHLLAKGMYLPYWLTHDRSTFADFAALRLTDIIIGARLMMTVLHLLSFAALYRVAMRVLENSATSFLAVLIYATTYSTLFYFNEISVEPLVVLFALLCFLCVWRFEDEMRRYRFKTAYLHAILGALCMALALYSKLLIMASIVLFVPAYIAVLGHRNARRDPLSRRAWLAGVGVFAGASALFLIGGALKINWTKFFRYWNDVPRAEMKLPSLAAQSDGTVIDAILTALKLAAEQLLNRFHPSFWAVENTRAGHGYVAEMGCTLLAVTGMIWLWYRYRAKRRFLIPIVVFSAMISPPILYKSLWHYYVVYYAFGAVFCAFAIEKLLRKLLAGRTSNKPVGAVKLYVLATVVVALLHSPGVVLVIDKHRFNSRQYHAWRPLYRALDEASDGETIAVKNAPPLDHLTGRITFYMGRNHPIRDALSRRIIRVRSLNGALIAKYNISRLVEFNPDGRTTLTEL